MAGRQPSRKGKEPAVAPSRGSGFGNLDEPIVIEDQGCTLIIEGTIPRTPLLRAKCQGRHCVAISKGLEDAYNMHNILNMCDHPNILKPIGVWLDPTDNMKAYIAVTHVESALVCLDMKQLFCVEQKSLYGFSKQGFGVFRQIFSAVQYVNSRYEGAATSCTSNTSPIPLFPMMLEPENIFLNLRSDQIQVMLGNFKTNVSDDKDTTREDIEWAHWKEVGRSLGSLWDDSYKASPELSELADFLNNGPVTYQELLWKTGIWDAHTKTQFIREIFVLLERDDERIKKERDLKNKRPLGLLDIMNDFTPPRDRNEQPKDIRDDHLLHSFQFLRHKIVAHFDEEYGSFKGSKIEIGTSMATREMYIQKRKPEYMIELAKAIRELGWITESPVLRGENDYMASFYKK